MREPSARPTTSPAFMPAAISAALNCSCGSSSVTATTGEKCLQYIEYFTGAQNMQELFMEGIIEKP